MNSSESNQSETDGGPPWRRATLADLEDLDFEKPIAASKSADCQELSDLFRAAIQPTQSDPLDTSPNRIFAMLAAICGFHFKPSERNEPFGPMFRSADRRSAVPEDFRGPPLEVLASMTGRARHPALRARLFDLCWLLDRKRGDVGTSAVQAYIDTIRKVENAELSFRFEMDTGALAHDSRNLLRRALQIGRAIGWEKPATKSARDLALKLREHAASENKPVPMLWFAGLDLDFGVSEPGSVGQKIEEVLQHLTSDKSYIVVELWRLAARAYHLAGNLERQHECQSNAAECLVAEVERQPSPMLASHWLSSAIREFHGAPRKKERRTELRHRLIDIQGHIPDEMSHFSQTIDLKELAEAAERAITGKSLLDKLLIFACLTQSPDPEVVRQEALKRIQEFPLASLFGATHHDDEGKVVHRTEGGAGDGGLSQQIAQCEDIRRTVVVGGTIEPARLLIAREHYLSDEVFIALLRHSPFVPNDQVATISRAFVRFFHGDFISAVYILTPLLENSFRYVLKSHGHDVTIFDDATQVQEDRTLSSLYEQMRSQLESIFGAAVVSDVENVFLRRPGPSLRNTVAHGLLNDGGPFNENAIYGCWLIFRLCCLPLIPHRQDIDLNFV